MAIKWSMLVKEAITAKTIAAFFLGLLVGTGAFTTVLGPTLIAPAAPPYMKPYPMPHKYWSKTDEFYVFASGGQQGGVFVYGIPSMKLLAEIPVFTVDPAWGWTPEDVKVKEMLTNPWTGELAIYGDTHHPAISRTNAVYDGRWLFINDKIHPRLARIDLNTFRTGQILWIPNIVGGIHGAHVSPNTDLLIGNFELEQYPDQKIIDYLKAKDPTLTVDRTAGPYLGGFAGVNVSADGTMTNAWQVWGPWHHDMVRVGWGKSEGWIINTAYNTERAVSSIPMFNRTNDYVFFWKIESIRKAVRDGKYTTTTQAPNVPVIAWKDVEVYAAKVPLNPHGIDVSPTGKYILIGGKATTIVTAIDFEKVLEAIQVQRFVDQEFGVKILDSDYVNAAVMDIGLGPTHIEFDNKGFTYIGFFVDSDIKKVPLGAPYTEKHKMTDKVWKVVDTIPVHYSVGHLLVPGGDMKEPYGKYLISMNKLSKDTFLPHGPLRTENHELFNIEEIPAKLIDQMPIIPETHYSQAIPVEKIVTTSVYTLPAVIATPGVEYDYQKKEVRVNMTVVRSFFNPDWFTVPEGWKVKIHMTNVEAAIDLTHGFALEGYDVLIAIDPGQVRDIEVKADKAGVYWYYCIWFCSELHLEMRGRMIVIPENEWRQDLEWRP